jgi:nucleolar pre-ribosomal-associated protein 1
LKALPDHRPTAPAELPADLVVIDMQDESKCVITFLDECVQRCLKTPYKYVEALRSLADASAPYSHHSIGMDYSNRLDERPSPLLMTLLENLQSRITNNTLPSAHIIAVTAYIGRLLFHLLGKNDLDLLRAFVDKVEDVLMQCDEGENRAETMATALRRELEVMRSALTFNIAGELEMVVETGTPHWMASSEAVSTRRFFDLLVR